MTTNGTAELRSETEFLRAVIDGFPAPVLVVDRNLTVHDANAAAREFIGQKASTILRSLCGDVMRCFNARLGSGGCGTSGLCPQCVIREAAQSAAAGEGRFRRITAMRVERDGFSRETWFLVSGAPFQYGEMDLVLLTLEDVTELIELRRIIPICANCKKVRDDHDFWDSVENYLSKTTAMEFTHGVCPDCMKKLYPGVMD